MTANLIFKWLKKARLVPIARAPSPWERVALGPADAHCSFLQDRSGDRKHGVRAATVGLTLPWHPELFRRRGPGSGRVKAGRSRAPGVRPTTAQHPDHEIVA